MIRFLLTAGAGFALGALVATVGFNTHPDLPGPPVLPERLGHGAAAGDVLLGGPQPAAPPQAVVTLSGTDFDHLASCCIDAVYCKQLETKHAR